MIHSRPRHSEETSRWTNPDTPLARKICKAVDLRSLKGLALAAKLLFGVRNRNEPPRIRCRYIIDDSNMFIVPRPQETLHHMYHNSEYRVPFAIDDIDKKTVYEHHRIDLGRAAFFRFTTVDAAPCSMYFQICRWSKVLYRID